MVSAACVAEEGEESSFSGLKIFFQLYKEWIYACMKALYCIPVLLFCFHIENSRSAQTTLKFVLNVSNGNFSLKACRETLERLGFEGLSHVYS